MLYTYMNVWCKVGRILEKVVRCYKGDPTRVLDVCRYSSVHTVVYACLVE